MQCCNTCNNIRGGNMFDQNFSSQLSGRCLREPISQSGLDYVARIFPPIFLDYFQNDSRNHVIDRSLPNGQFKCSSFIRLMND